MNKRNGTVTEDDQRADVLLYAAFALLGGLMPPEFGAPHADAP